MKKAILIQLCILAFLQGNAQTNILSTNPVAEEVMLGNYDPADYMATNVINLPDDISQGILANVSLDSLKSYLVALNTFQTRNSGSDTVSFDKGIGAARRWIHSKFESFSAQHENRLIASYLQFDLNICDILQHKNVFAVLPGMDTADKSVVLVEAHMDTRCAGLCDTACLAEGMEDNGSGTALVIELARVMSRYSYNHTIVFLLVTAEEQGLLGAQAFADYAVQKGIALKTVMNNDVSGGIVCGQTASQPGCSGEGAVDSTHIRLFSQGNFNSFHKGLSRYIKLEYKEMIQPFAAVSMGINIMTPEDRTGRSGDHKPFRIAGFTSMRLTAANEHGNADVDDPNYHDRQHTSGDVLGIDVDNDQVIDTYYVNFNYLARNVVVNGNAMAMAAISPATPDFALTSHSHNDLVVDVTTQQQYLHYRVGVRTTTHDWDSVYTFTGATKDTIYVAPGNYIVSIASVDDKGVESIFSKEIMTGVTGAGGPATVSSGVELLQNNPNPADEATMISVKVNKAFSYKTAFISIKDLNGKEVKRENITLDEGVNDVMYEHGYHMSGTFIYTLYIDGTPIQSKKMVFNN
jgi:hypothetical protein